MKRKVYVLHPGVITDAATGRARHVDECELARLYGVEMSECEIDRGPRPFDRRSYTHDRDPYKGMTHLYPRADGMYQKVGAN